MQCISVQGVAYSSNDLTPFTMGGSDTRRRQIEEGYRAYLDGRGRLEWFLNILGQSPSEEDQQLLELLERDTGKLTPSQIEKLKQLKART